MENQTDLEVILEFLEEYYSHNTGDGREKVGEACALPILVPKEEHLRETCFEYWIHESGRPDLQTMQSEYTISSFNHQHTPTLSEHGSVPNSVSPWQSATRPARAAGSGQKVRLFHFLFEMLEDPDMAHCVSWVPASAGLFRFSSKNKEHVAALWGQRKGNKRPMTYQKMSRALRNYNRSGEILKVKRKLTYQFGRDTLNALRKSRQGRL